MKLSAREEIVVELFRSMDIEQRRELVQQMRATIDANRAIQSKLKKPLRLVGNARIEAKFGKAPPRFRRHTMTKASDKPQPRRPDRNQDDNESEV